MATSQSTQDLAHARSQASFSPTAFHSLLRPGETSARRERVVEVLSKEKVFDKTHVPYLSRQQAMERGFKITRRLLELKEELGWSYEEYLEALSASDEAIGINLHEVAFQPVLSSQASDAQQAEWLPNVVSHSWIGCYLQTELGHGSNVQQLETTATFDEKSKEFVLNSPTISSTKWWIGALGLLATHGVVQARLIIKGKDYGPHLFLTQLRSLEDHSVLPGIEAGEIGPKVHSGMNAVDNGFARFSSVQLPLNSLLARFARVSPEGKYSQPPHSKLSYGGMIFIRAQMIGNLGWRLGKAATISTRYLHTRRQFGSSDSTDGREAQVISYPGVYMRVLPQIVNAIVFITIGKDMANLYTLMSSQLSSGNTALLAETHAVSSGLKTFVSTAVVDGIEVARRAMGGHGFLASSGVGRIWANELPSATYEGDNYILHLQVARHALKSLSLVTSNPSLATSLPPSASYLSTLSSSTNLPLSFPSSSSLSLPTILQLLSLVAAHSVLRLSKLVASGRAWSELSWESVAVSESVTGCYVAKRMVAAVEGKEKGDGLLSNGVGAKEKEVATKVVRFYLLNSLSRAVPQLLEFGIVAPAPSSTSSPIELIRAHLSDAANALLPEMVTLVDAFGFTDWELDTTVGNYEGQPYETLLARAKADMAANVGDEATRKRMYEEHIRPILRAGKKASKL